MKALVKYEKGIGNVELKDVPVPEPKSNEVRIKIKSCGVCGTDIKIYEDKFPYNDPVIIGHEFSGIIDKIGSKVNQWKVGDRVVSEQHTKACGNCRYCLTGKRHLCNNKMAPGYGIDGAFAEYICVHCNLLHKIPDNMNFDQAALIEPMAVAAQGILNKSKIYPEETVVILGCGPIALLALQILKAQGAGKVILTGINDDEKIRFKIAERFGADYTVNVLKNDPVEFIMSLTDEVGADLVVDLSGAPSAILQGFKMLRKEGRFCALGLTDNTIGISWMDIALKALEVYYSYSSDYPSWERCLSMIERGKINTEEFTKDIYSLNNWQEAFDRAKSGEALKVIIKPGD